MLGWDCDVVLASDPCLEGGVMCGQLIPRSVALALGAMVLLLPHLSWADAESDNWVCVWGATPQAQIAACTRLLSSGQFGPRKRARIYNNRGVSYRRLKQYRRAIQDYDEAIRLNSRVALAYYNRGIVYGILRQYSRAIQNYDEALRLSPRFAIAYNNRGNAYSNLKQYRRAIQDYDEVLRLDPRYAIAYYNRGLAYEALGQKKEAVRNYRQSLRLDPSLKENLDRLRRFGTAI
jgi:tetratricopeptide (TPR) repeat protein